MISIPSPTQATVRSSVLAIASFPSRTPRL
jgi:hypothetical protein